MSGTVILPRAPEYSVDIEQEGDGVVILNRVSTTQSGFRINARTLRGEKGVKVRLHDNDGGTLIVESAGSIDPETVRGGTGVTITGGEVFSGGTLTVALTNVLAAPTTFFTAFVNQQGQVTGGATIPPSMVGAAGVTVSGALGVSPVTIALTPLLITEATYTSVMVNREGRITGGSLVNGDGTIGTISAGTPGAGAPVRPVRTVVDASTTFPAVPLVTNPGAMTIAVRQIQAGEGIIVAPGAGTVIVSAAPPQERHIAVDLSFNPNGSLVGCAPTFVQPNISIIVQDDGDLQVTHPDAEVLDVTAWRGGPNNTMFRVNNPTYAVTLSIATGSTIVSGLDIGSLGGRGQVTGRLVFVVRNR